MTITIVSSENGRSGAMAAMQLMREGGSALDAVELACRIVEADPADHSVGYGGIPNLLGEVELDASIMDGRTLAAGAVAALHGYGHPITLARRVMEETPHVLLAGRGAERLAAELGQRAADQRTDAAIQRWEERFAQRNVDRGAMPALRTAASVMTGPLNLRDRAARGERIDTLGTVNFLALDGQGNLASAVSTSGIGWKYPGRVGDSPLIGAGNYCDNRYGAAACTGMGELAVRAATARSLVLYLKLGMSLAQAGAEALRDLDFLDAREGHYMNIVALTPDGEHAGFTTIPGKQYLYQQSDMKEPILADRQSLTSDTFR
ncbi:MAG: N(4)-(beta-N-acetylglucosaminyl)-L-asparaginase [Caldilineaceae bacterium]|nr:N(4)-(beta-N-acetylglucosaminyl)-L-asparaginase [Caldilineaceae bacterium]